MRVLAPVAVALVLLVVTVQALEFFDQADIVAQYRSRKNYLHTQSITLNSRGSINIHPPREEDKSAHMVAYGLKGRLYGRADPDAIIEGWDCDVRYYNGSDGCDCACGIQDPDCDSTNPAVNAVLNCDRENATCVGGSCTVSAPDDWTCEPQYYNAMDGCDCGCGVEDPDCYTPAVGFQPIYNCEAFTSPRCLRGRCAASLPNPVRIAWENMNFLVAACGKIVTSLEDIPADDNYGGDDYGGEDYEGEDYEGEDFKRQQQAATKPGFNVKLQASNWMLVEDTDSNFTAIASIESLDPSIQVKLVGRTEVPFFKGMATFDNLIALGPSDAEFFITIDSEPKLIQAKSYWPVVLQTGDPVKSIFKIRGTSWKHPNGTYSVASDSEITGELIVVDDCGNKLKNGSSPQVTCFGVDHRTLLAIEELCNTTTFNTPSIVTLKMPSTPGIYDAYFFNDDVNVHPNATEIVLGSITFDVQPKAEYQCFKLVDSRAGISGEDVANFDATMLSKKTYIQISQALFSTDTDRPSILTIKFNSSSKTTPFHNSLHSNFTQWNLAAKSFFVEQDPVFLQVISLGLVSVESPPIETELLLPFCASVGPDTQRRLIAGWLYALSDAVATFEQNSGNADPNSTLKVQSTSDIVCYGNYQSYSCCSRISLVGPRGECPAPLISSLSISLIAISVTFAFLASVYAVALVSVFFQQSGAIYTAMEDITSLSEADLQTKKRNSFLVALLSPVVMLAGTVQTILLINADKGYAGLRILVGVVEGLVMALWWIIAFYHFFTVYVKGNAPSRRTDLLYFISTLTVIFFTLFNIFWTFAWVTLGLLLNPGRVVAYFVAFLTVFAVAVFKISALVDTMKQVELGLHKELFRRFLKAKGKEWTDEDFETIETITLEGPKLIAYLKSKDFDDAEAEKMALQIAKFRRFKVRFIIGNLIGSIVLLTALLVFILLGVEAFRTKSGAVGSIGSVLEGVAGASTVVNEKLGDKQQDIQQLVQTFAKLKGGRASTIPTNNIELGAD